MARVVGLGGVFMKCEQIDQMRKWFEDNLGISGDWGAMFPFKNDDPEGFSMLCAFKPDTDYFEPSKEPYMINLRVDDLDGLVAKLEANGVEILGREDGPHGRFAWIMDPEGLKIELWQQTGPAPR